MTQPYASFGVAASIEPLSTTSPNSLLFDCDGPVFFALDYWSWLIANYHGPRLLQAAATWAVPIASPVAQRYPYNPGPYMQEGWFQFPLLSVYRKTAEYKRNEAGWESDHCAFDLVFTLPALTAAQAEQAAPILRAVEATIRHKTGYGFDPGYAPPGGTLGQGPWGTGFAGLERIDLNRGSMGGLEDAGNLFFPSLRMEGTFVERDMYVSTGAKFAGADVTVQLTNADGTSIPNFEQVATQQAPTITSLSVTSGTHLGGTSVTIAGTLFLTSPVVLFGITPATGVVCNSATSITCVTPAVSGAGTLGVTVVNRDGQSVSAPSAFTYS